VRQPDVQRHRHRTGEQVLRGSSYVGDSEVVPRQTVGYQVPYKGLITAFYLFS